VSLFTILLLEDDEFLARGIIKALQTAGFKVDHFINGKHGFTALLEREYSAVILDLNLPEMEGLEILQAIREKLSSVPVLILTARDSIEDRVHGLNMGADDYLTKPFDLDELEARVRALLRRRDVKLQPEIIVGRLHFDIFGRRASIDGTFIQLAARETDLLEILLAHRGQIVNKEDVLDKLFGFDREIGLNAVEVCMHRLRKKCAGAGIVFRTFRSLGYVLEEEK
jgi:DNA-binding response OmpR family regulator